MSFNIVLFNPVIPQNTGSTARLCAATNTVLHLIEPLGFEISDRYLKRAGLDYWPEVQLKTHKSWDHFISNEHVSAEQLWLFSKKASSPYCKTEYKIGDYLVFGSETKGLPDNLHEMYPEQRMLIPMDNPNVRSLNLATAAGIVLYEARRQNSIGLSHF